MTEPLISDHERDRAVARLRDGTADGRLSLEEFADRVGAAYVARTAGQLEQVVEDLPAVSRVPARTPTRRIVSFLGGARQQGRWRPARPTTAVAVLGSCVVDLCDAEVDGDEIEIRAVAVLGGIEVLVPEGVPAELGGFNFVGSRDYRVRERDVRAGLPVVRVRATTVFGGVTVRTRPFTAGRRSSG